MKILVISATSWSNDNSFGNTFSNLFEGMDDVEIYNVCCRNGDNNNSVVKQAVQFTDKSVLKSIYKLGYDPCWKMSSGNLHKKDNVEVYAGARKSRRLIYFLARDLIWKLGKWKKSKTFNNFLDEIKPDILYLPIYHSQYLNDVQQYAIKKLNVPVVGHISDDIYGMAPNLGFFAKMRAKSIHKKIEKTISMCSYLEVFAENMAKQYSEIFSVPCYVVGKGIDVSKIPDVSNFKHNKGKKRFVYTGNINDERFNSLLEIGKSLKRSCTEDEAVLEIYSASLLDEKMKNGFDSCPNIHFGGKLSKCEVDSVQREADFLVHVEGFGEQAIFEAGMSFSTKIIDYMLMGKPILAVGSSKINSIQVLIDYNAAVVANSKDDICAKVKELLNNEVDINAVLNNASTYLANKRDIKKIQSGIKDRLTTLLEEKYDTVF